MISASVPHGVFNYEILLNRLSCSVSPPISTIPTRECNTYGHCGAGSNPATGFLSTWCDDRYDAGSSPVLEGHKQIRTEGIVGATAPSQVGFLESFLTMVAPTSSNLQCLRKSVRSFLDPIFLFVYAVCIHVCIHCYGKIGSSSSSECKRKRKRLHFGGCA